MGEQIIKSALQDVVQEIRVQSLTKHVRDFHGEGTGKFMNWLHDMDQIAPSCDSKRMCVLATLTLGGSAGTYVSRTLKSDENMSWETLRAKLKERYSDSDPFMAQEKCRRLHQNKNESVQNFAERLLSAAEEAYSNVNQTEVQRTLVEIFQRGVLDDRLARSLIRKKFEKLEEAVKFATEEQLADRTFELYRHHQAPEPMEVDVIRQQSEEAQGLAQIQENIQKLSKQLDRVSRQIRPQNPHPHQQSRRSQSVPTYSQVPPSTQFSHRPCRPDKTRLGRRRRSPAIARVSEIRH